MEGPTGGEPRQIWSTIVNTWLSAYVARVVERELEAARRLHHTPDTWGIRRRRRRGRRAS